MAKKSYKPEKIIDKVEGQYEATEPLRNRMDKDYSLYRLDPYDAGDGYQSYTSNEPSTYADKIISSSPSWVLPAIIKSCNKKDLDLKKSV